MNEQVTVKKKGQIIGHFRWDGGGYNATAVNPATGETRWLGMFYATTVGESYDNAQAAVKKHKWETAVTV